MPYRDEIEALESRCRSLADRSAQLGDELAAARRQLDEAQAQRRLPVLDNLRVAAPCRASWDDMPGDERTRFCGECKQNVFNLSEMTRAEAEALIVEKQGKLCVRYFRRSDGTVMTADCPVGMRRRRRRRRVVAAAFAVVSAVTGVVTVLFWRTCERHPAVKNVAHATMGGLGAESIEPATMGGVLAEPLEPAPLRGTELQQKK